MVMARRSTLRSTAWLLKLFWIQQKEYMNVGDSPWNWPPLFLILLFVWNVGRKRWRNRGMSSNLGARGRWVESPQITARILKNHAFASYEISESIRYSQLSLVLT